jgi:hypothetical protein
VAHCAAGVRWLSHLHAVALASAAVGAGHEAGREAGHEAGHEGGREAGHEAGHEAGREAGHEAGASVSASAGANGGGQNGPSLQGAACAAAAELAGPRRGWAQEAAEHPTVVEWFHALVRDNFHGTLKVGGPLPLWHRPAASLEGCGGGGAVEGCAPVPMRREPHPCTCLCLYFHRAAFSPYTLDLYLQVYARARACAPVPLRREPHPCPHSSCCLAGPGGGGLSPLDRLYNIDNSRPMTSPIIFDSRPAGPASTACAPTPLWLPKTPNTQKPRNPETPKP